MFTNLFIFKVVPGAGTDVLVGESPIFLHNVVKRCRDQAHVTRVADTTLCRVAVKLQHDFYQHTPSASCNAAATVDLEFTVYDKYSSPPHTFPSSSVTTAQTNSLPPTEIANRRRVCR